MAVSQNFVVLCGKVLTQIVILGITPIQLYAQLTIADVSTVLKLTSCPVVEAECAFLSTLDDQQLSLPVHALSPDQQKLLHQLLMKHMLVFAGGPDKYGCTSDFDHTIHTGEDVFSTEKY